VLIAGRWYEVNDLQLIAWSEDVPGARLDGFRCEVYREREAFALSGPLNSIQAVRRAL